MNWKDSGDVAFYIATASTVLFATLYFILAPWWKTVTGRNIMSVMGAMAVAFGYFSWAITVGGIPPGFDPIRALLFSLLAASVTWRTVIFIKRHIIESLQAKERKQDELENSR